MSLITLLVLVCIINVVHGFRSLAIPQRSSSLHMSTMSGDIKDIILTDTGNGLSKAELNEYILAVSV